MDKKIPITKLLVITIKCVMWGHDEEVLQVFHPWCRRVICHRCGCDWFENDHGDVRTPWNQATELFYEEAGFRIRRPDGLPELPK